MKSKNRCHNYEDDVNIIDSNKLKNSLHKQSKLNIYYVLNYYFYYLSKNGI